MIRVAETSDYKEMDAVFRASAKALCIKEYGSQTIEAWAGEAKPERFVHSAEEGSEQYVTLLGGKVVCFGELNIEKQLLLSLFVSPEHAGKGVGQEMIEFLLGKARSAGVKVLRVDSSVNAAKFYARNDFIEKSKSEFATQSGVVLESVKMECALST